MNGTPTNINRKRTSRHPLLEDIKADMKARPDVYVALGVGMVGSLIIGYKMKYVPKVDKTAVLNEWLTEMAAQGINVYGLSNEQKALWESVWAFATLQAKRPGWDTARVVKRMVSDYSEMIDRYSPVVNIA